MPELPEVEVTRLSVAPDLLGARVLAIEMGRPLRWPLGREPAMLAGLVCGEMSRRGKYLWLPLRSPGDAGPDDSRRAGLPRAAAAPELPDASVGGLLIHLGMSGALSFGECPPGLRPHEHFRLTTDRGGLWLIDPRRFGAVVWSASRAADPARKLLAGLGPEPFDPALDAVGFHAALQARRTPVKTALLSGELVVGAGNIYACEALHLARIDPRLPSNRISRPRAAAGGGPAGARTGDPGGRNDVEGFQRERRGRPLPGAGAGLRPRRAALQHLRGARPPHRPGPARDVLLRGLPEEVVTRCRSLYPEVSLVSGVPGCQVPCGRVVCDLLLISMRYPAIAPIQSRYDRRSCGRLRHGRYAAFRRR
jgi:formamidopyrimidine-DNA glycosylase